MKLFQAELYRRLAELRRAWIFVVVGNLVFCASIIGVSTLLGDGDAVRGSMSATVCWLTFISAACGASNEIGRSRRDCTITYFIGPRVYASLLRSALAKTLADLVVGLPPALVATIVIGLLSGQALHPLSLVGAVIGAVLAGLAVGPALWSISLWLKSAQAFVAGVGLMGYALIMIDAKPPGQGGLLGVISATSPLEMAAIVSGASSPDRMVVFGAAWTVVLAVSLALGALLSKFVREGGDLVQDAIY